jgi:hypothetical protein
MNNIDAMLLLKLLQVNLMLMERNDIDVSCFWLNSSCFDVTSPKPSSEIKVLSILSPYM